MLKCFESGQAVVKLGTLEAAVLTNISSQISIGVELILEDMLALGAEDALCIVVSQLSWAFLGIKSIVADRILQTDRVKRGLSPFISTVASGTLAAASRTSGRS